MICRLSLGINASILLILLIFSVLFSLPLKLLLNTNYGTRINESENSEDILFKRQDYIDYKSLKRCRNFEYQFMMESVFFTSYDGNCTHVKEPDSKTARVIQNRKSEHRLMAENAGIIPKEFTAEETNENMSSINHKKSISIAGHILAAMLIISAVAALVEVLRARFFAIIKEPRADGSASTARRSSLVDLAQRRHVRKETMQAQKSFEIQGMMHRSPLRLIAARPPPLLRRSSFPAQCLNKKDVPISTANATIGRLSRRPSLIMDLDEDSNSLTDSRRHSRLIRRH